MYVKDQKKNFRFSCRVFFENSRDEILLETRVLRFREAKTSYKTLRVLLENRGLEPLTLGLQSRCSSQLS